MDSDPDIEIVDKIDKDSGMVNLFYLRLKLCKSKYMWCEIFLFYSFDYRRRKMRHLKEKV